MKIKMNGLRTMRHVFISLSLAFIAILTPPAFAAGMDCAHAQSQTEKAICASDELHRRYEDLSAIYDRLLHSLPKQQRAGLRAAQRDWLKKRDECGADWNCIVDRYIARSEELKQQLAEQPDDVDKAAIKDIRERDGDYSQFVISEGETTFSSIRTKRDDCDEEINNCADYSLPETRPEGVTPDEWDALQASGINVGEDDYTLLDLDGDGQRDLIIDWSDEPGVGKGNMVNTVASTSAFHREGSRFVGFDGTFLDNGICATSDGNVTQESCTWIRLRGRVYAVIEDTSETQYGIYLVKPFSSHGKMPILTKGYRLQLSVPIDQKDENGKPYKLDDKLHQALTAAVHLAADGARDKDEPICPIPDSTTNDDEYYAYSILAEGIMRYEPEVIGDVPILLGDECYFGRVRIWPIGSGATPDNIEILMRKSIASQDEAERSFVVKEDGRELILVAPQ